MAPFGRSGSHPSDTLLQEELSLPAPDSTNRLKSSRLFSIERGSPSRCSRAVAPFGRSVGPPSIIQVVLRAQWQMALSLLVQHGRGSLRLQWGPPARCIRRTGLPLLVQQSRSSLRLQCGPSVCHLSYVAYLAADRALPPSVCRLKLRCVLGGGRGSPSWYNRAVAPFGHNGGPPPSSHASNHASSPAARLALPVQQSRSSLRKQREPLI
ncbi:hypothetical protein ROHU_008444 [Labeo rohita]|uniref:Uncharacterized protein n=1 Tax=Labeo rohita TaxID=84645 RepID=A0A498M611_LABRO|nr:hypothetical protein ROHU_008444 [Labeo rohita]